MNTRRIFGRPIRQDTTGEFYPNKMTAEEFCEEFAASFQGFLANMKSLNIDQKARYVEEWAEIWLGWCEVESDKNYHE